MPSTMNFSIISAVNHEEVLNSCLLSSPDINKVREVILQRGFDSAADAYNAAIAKSKGDVLIFIHQDVYLPAGWFGQLETTIKQLAVSDPQWGVLGVYGFTAAANNVGYLYCNGNQGQLGNPIQGPVEVAILDEVVLIVRRDSGLHFDSALPGFHLYGADICLTARQRFHKVYVVPGFCFHNSNGYGLFPRSFWSGYFYMRSKWKSHLPVRTPCIEISRALWPVLTGTVWRFIWQKVQRIKIVRRVDNPAKLYARLFSDLGKESNGRG
jgi:glycosyltransferase involved in cell wall biosynthesis